MVKIRKISFLLPVLAVLFAFLLPSSIEAAQFEVGSYNLDNQSVVEDDLYVTGDNITISGIVDGDVLAAGENITIDGTVTGNLFVAGSTVTVEGNVYGTVMVAGSTISLDGTIGRDVIAAGMTVNSSADISQDLTVMSANANINGNIGDDFRAAAGEVTSDATIGGDFVFTGESYSIDEDNVAGDIVHRVGESRDIQFEVPTYNWSTFSGVNIGLSLISFLGMFLVGAVLIYLAPVKTLQVGNNISNSWEDALKSFAIGLLVLFAIPLPLFLLAITIIGAPLAFLITGILLFLTIFGVVWAEIAIGNVVLNKLFNKKDDQRYLSLLVGRLISVIVRLIPIIGAIYSLTLMMLTVGAVVRTKTHALTQATKKSKK